MLSRRRRAARARAWLAARSGRGLDRGWGVPRRGAWRAGRGGRAGGGLVAGGALELLTSLPYSYSHTLPRLTLFLFIFLLAG